MTCLEGELEPVAPRALRGGARDDGALDGERHAVLFQGASERGGVEVGFTGGVSGTNRQGGETAVSHRVWLVVVVVAVIVCTSFVCMRRPNPFPFPFPDLGMPVVISTSDTSSEGVMICIVLCVGTWCSRAWVDVG